MRKVLIGQEHSKRTDFLRKAAEQEGMTLEFLPWEMLQQNDEPGQLKGAAVKIDPPSFQTVHLCSMQEYLQEYQKMLQKLAQLPCHFLNHPDGVCQMLDKRGTKELLQKNGVKVTELFPEEIENSEQLMAVMQKKRCFAVFVKPRYFSGAAGVMAFRIHPVKEKMVAYTSCRLEKDTLINTKKLFRLENKQEITQLLDALLQLPCVVERWHPKETFQGKTYDLRVVYQYGHIAYIVVRQSAGPITNLHLNNQAVSLDRLGLQQSQIEEIADLCEKAVHVFPGISMAGIDVMLDKETKYPRIIEMNGQGDLIYQDIYHENRIYREQIRWMEKQVRSEVSRMESSCVRETKSQLGRKQQKEKTCRK